MSTGEAAPSSFETPVEFILAPAKGRTRGRAPQSLAENSIPHPEERLKGASRRVAEARNTGSCFETPAAQAPQHEGFGSAANFRSDSQDEGYRSSRALMLRSKAKPCVSKHGKVAYIHRISSGTISDVASPFRPIAMPANVPATSSTTKARAVPMPCEARPTAKPRAA